MDSKNKGHIIKFRCTASEKNNIKNKARLAGIKLSEYCRRQILSGKVISRPQLSEEEKLFFRLLKEHNTSFARIGSLLKYKDPGLMHAIYEHLEKMKKLYIKFFPK